MKIEIKIGGEGEASSVMVDDQLVVNAEAGRRAQGTLSAVPFDHVWFLNLSDEQRINFVDSLRADIVKAANRISELIRERDALHANWIRADAESARLAEQLRRDAQSGGGASQRAQLDGSGGAGGAGRLIEASADIVIKGKGA